MKRFRQGEWLLALVCILIGFMIAVQFRTAQDAKDTVSQQRLEEISDRLLLAEHERNELSEELRRMREAADDQESNAGEEMLRYRAGLVPLVGEGVIVRMDDSPKAAKSGKIRIFTSSMMMISSASSMNCVPPAQRRFPSMDRG